MGGLSDQNRMSRFVQDYGSTHAGVRRTDGREWLEIDEPAILASFVAFCKASLQSKGRRVYLRGLSRHHPTQVPTLFRDADQAQGRRRWKAYRQFLDELPRVVKGTRFTKKNFGAVLQHYGFRTPWLDVVDDLNVAIWFALNNFKEMNGACNYQRSAEDSGWLMVIAATHVHRVIDLRRRQSSRNTRCHTQQGFSMAMQHDDKEPHEVQDFMPSVVGVVKIPNSKRWLVTGYRASQDYFFPSPKTDDTYAKLLDFNVEELARRAESDHGLPPGALGSVGRYGNIPAI